MIRKEVYTQLEKFNIDKAEVDKQYALLTQGANYIYLKSAATIHNGIKSLPEKEAGIYANYYHSRSADTLIQKFVPASGAATRMFKELSEFLGSGIENSSVKNLFESIDKLAFANLIPTNLNHQKLAHCILINLNFQSTPKGLIPFHKYKGFTRTPYEEHWVEGFKYAASNGKVKLHFTISEGHQNAFKQLYNSNIKSFEDQFQLGLEIDFSQQNKSTDTIIVDHKGKILLDKNNSPVLRPGGHGALIENLNTLKADLVFIKNIDNIAHENHLEATVLYKKALAGLLLELKDSVFNQLIAISNNTFQLKELEQVGNEIMIQTPKEYSNWLVDSKINFWKGKFNRPIRVCGMVKNEGAPGGGPFWIQGKHGVSLQIVESAQINLTDTKQNKILQGSTHFNPVDLVCYLTDYQGNKFNLLDFVDESSAFITSKTVNGKEVNVLEHPGLWNGAMADWNTIFVEVPINTFNPVKTVNDLLMPSHQP